MFSSWLDMHGVYCRRTWGEGPGCVDKIIVYLSSMTLSADPSYFDSNFEQRPTWFDAFSSFATCRGASSHGAQWEPHLTRQKRQTRRLVRVYRGEGEGVEVVLHEGLKYRDVGLSLEGCGLVLARPVEAPAAPRTPTRPPSHHAVLPVQTQPLPLRAKATPKARMASESRLVSRADVRVVL